MKFRRGDLIFLWFRLFPGQIFFQFCFPIFIFLSSLSFIFLSYTSYLPLPTLTLLTLLLHFSATNWRHQMAFFRTRWTSEGIRFGTLNWCIFGREFAFGWLVKDDGRRVSGVASITYLLRHSRHHRRLAGSQRRNANSPPPSSPLWLARVRITKWQFLNFKTTAAPPTSILSSPTCSLTCVIKRFFF